jgi:hypothetical protein
MQGSAEILKARSLTALKALNQSMEKSSKHCIKRDKISIKPREYE